MPIATEVFTGPIGWIFRLYTFLLSRKFERVGSGCSFHPLLNINHPERVVLGSDVVIGSFTWIGVYIDNIKKTGRLTIGDRVHIGSNSTILARNKIKIGNRVLISQRVVILDNIHEYQDINKAIIDQPISRGGEIIIDDDCFIGINSVILQNVRIGKHAVIGASSVVTHDVPAYSVVAGVPAKVIKKYDFKKGKYV